MHLTLTPEESRRIYNSYPTNRYLQVQLSVSQSKNKERESEREREGQRGSEGEGGRVRRERGGQRGSEGEGESEESEERERGRLVVTYPSYNREQDRIVYPAIYMVRLYSD